MKRSVFWLGLMVCTVLAVSPAFAYYLVDFAPMPDYPDVSKSVVADVLGNGRFILYDGDSVYIEHYPDRGTFAEVASGYIGDPAFITVAPDGHRCLLGAGEVDFGGDPNNDWLWLFDADNPEDAPPVDINGYVSDGLMLLTSTYWGEWLNNDLVLIERAPGWVSELGIVDVTTTTYRKVADKGESSASFVTYSQFSVGEIYATIGFGTGEGDTRRFSKRVLMNIFHDPAYDPATSPLSWDAGAYVGNYVDFSAGPSAVSEGGVLIFGSHNSELLYVDPDTGDPLGASVPIGGKTGCSVRPYFNPVTKKILVTETDWGSAPDWIPTFAGYISEETYEDLPAAGGAALAGLAALIVMAARRKLR